MRYARRFSVSTRLLAGVLPLCATLALGCHGEVGPTGPGGSYKETPICDASDPTQLLAPQRIALLTSTQLMNMVRLVSNDATQMIIDMGKFPVISDLTVRFPPPRTEQYHSIIDADSLSPFNNTAQTLGDYVTANFATVTGCATPATDTCAQSYLNGLAKKAYRRALTTDESTRLTMESGGAYELAGALNGIARGQGFAEPAFTVACLKRALDHLHKSQAGLEAVAPKQLLPETTVAEARKELFEIREGILRLMDEFRGRA